MAAMMRLIPEGATDDSYTKNGRAKVSGIR